MDSALIKMPDPGDAAYLIEFLMEIGPVNSGQSGPIPVSWSDINAWQQATGTILTGQELVQIRELSKLYCSQYHDSMDRNCPAPYVDPDAVDHNKLGNHIKKVFRARQENKKKKTMKPK